MMPAVTGPTCRPMRILMRESSKATYVAHNACMSSAKRARRAALSSRLTLGVSLTQPVAAR